MMIIITIRIHERDISCQYNHYAVDVLVL